MSATEESEDYCAVVAAARSGLGTSGDPKRVGPVASDARVLISCDVEEWRMVNQAPGAPIVYRNRGERGASSTNSKSAAGFNALLASKDFEAAMWPESSVLRRIPAHLCICSSLRVHETFASGPGRSVICAQARAMKALFGNLS